MTTVAGLDLSLTACGLARITWGHGQSVAETWHRGDKGITTQPYPERVQSLSHICADVLAWTEPCDLAVVEELVPNPKSRSTNERGALWYWVYRRLMDHDTPVLVVHSKTLKRYATGNGNADKREMWVAAEQAYPGAKVKTSDEADALWLSLLGVHVLGGPLAYELKDHHLDVVAGLRLPEEAA